MSSYVNVDIKLLDPAWNANGLFSTWMLILFDNSHACMLHFNTIDACVKGGHWNVNIHLQTANPDKHLCEWNVDSHFSTQKLLFLYELYI